MMNVSNATVGNCLGRGCPTAHTVQTSLETSWLLLCTFLVVSMQLGFAMLEVGSVREAHRMTVLAKNIMDGAVSCLVFAVASDLWSLSLVQRSDGMMLYDRALFNWAFCATCVTICSGSMAERTHIVGYLFHAALVAGIIFPPVAEAAWGTTGSSFLGWAMHGCIFHDFSYHDCAGSGVVHVVGGAAALAGNMVLGRRIMRHADEVDYLAANYPDPEMLGATRVEARSSGSSSEAAEEGAVDPKEASATEEKLGLLPSLASRWQRRFDSAARDRSEFQPCAYLQVMGMFILWFGWYGFNAGSSLSSGSGGGTLNPALVSWNTTLAAAAGGFGSYLYLYAFRLNLDTGFLCNGVLGGLVSITASCDIASPLAAAFIGFGAGLVVYPACSQLLVWLRIDDPVDAVPVHAGCGVFGVLVVGFCRPECEVLLKLSSMSDAQARFCSDGHRVGIQFVTQCVACLVIVGWTLLISFPFWLTLAVSERVRSGELVYIAEAEQQLVKLTHSIATGATTSSSSSSEAPVAVSVDAALVELSKQSRIVRILLKAHGWTGTSFLGGKPCELFSLVAKLQQAQTGPLETALEPEMSWLIRSIVGVCQQCWIMREISMVRLRIHPYAEISGLGAADTDGGRLFLAIQRAAGQIAALRNDQNSTVPLRSEVRELSMLVRSQDVLLRKLMRRKYSSKDTKNGIQSGSRLESVPESADESRLSPEQSASLPAIPVRPPPLPLDLELPVSCGASPIGGTPASTARTAWEDQRSDATSTTSFRVDWPAIHSSDTASTVSEASMGNLSPAGSYTSATPPTTNLHLPIAQTQNPVLSESVVHMLAMQNALMMQLISGPSVLQQTSQDGAGNSGPSPPGVSPLQLQQVQQMQHMQQMLAMQRSFPLQQQPQQQPAMQNQLVLLDALQRVADQQRGDSHSRPRSASSASSVTTGQNSLR